MLTPDQMNCLALSAIRGIIEDESDPVLIINAIKDELEKSGN